MSRLIRDWTDSETIDQITESAEIFFSRLTMKADDYGYYTANLKLLKSALYPLREEKTQKREVITIKKIDELLKECHEAGLIDLYTYNEKPYLFIYNFGQQKRTMTSKYPDRNGDLIAKDGSKVPFSNKRKKYGEQADNNGTSTVITPTPEEKRSEKGNEDRSSLIDIWLKDFPNSTTMETISRDLKIDKDTLVKRISDFKKSCRTNYKNSYECYDHFKMWANKNARNAETESSAKSSISFNKYNRK